MRAEEKKKKPHDTNEDTDLAFGVMHCLVRRRRLGDHIPVYIPLDRSDKSDSKPLNFLSLSTLLRVGPFPS